MGNQLDALTLATHMRRYDFAKLAFLGGPGPEHFGLIHHLKPKF